MASPSSFYRILCLVICVSLAWFSVVAKPIELPALSQRQYMSNLSDIVDAVEGVSQDSTGIVDVHLPATPNIATPTCVNHDHCASSSMITLTAPNMYKLTCSPPPHCSLDGGSVNATHFCYTKAGETVKLNALASTLAAANVKPLTPMLNHEFSPAPYSAASPVATALPAMTDGVDTTILTTSLDDVPSSEETVTFTAKLSKGHNGEPDKPEMTLAPEDAPVPISGQQTVYVTVTEDSTTASPIPTAPFNTNPLSTGHPESNKTAIILGSVFGSLTILCISIVVVDHLLKLRRQKREELQERQEHQEREEHQEHEEHQEYQQRHDSVSSVEDMSELLRRAQQTYGYYGTQRVASSSIVPQQMKVFPANPEPAELPTFKDGTVEKERCDSH